MAAAPRASLDLQPQGLAARNLDVSREHLQVYLDEFVFRHNRRRTPMAAFQMVLGVGANRPPTTYREITTHAA